MKKSIFLVVFGLFLVLSGTSDSEALEYQGNKRPMTFQDVIGVKHVSDPKISPDGRTVLFVVMERDLEKNSFEQQIWRYDSRTASSIELTASGSRNHSPRWSPDGDRFAFLSNRAGESQVFLMDPTGGEARPLTQHETAIRSFRWSPDGAKIAFTAVDPKSADRKKEEEAGDDARVMDAEFNWPKLWVIDVKTKEKQQILKDDVNVEEFAWSPDGSHFALRLRPTTLIDLMMRTDIYLMPSSGGALTRLTENNAVESNLVWAKDGESLFYTAAHESQFVNAESKLFRLNVTTREVERLASDYAFGINQLQLSPDGGRLYFSSGIKTDRRVCSIDLEHLDIEEHSPKQGVVMSYDVASNSPSVAFVFSDTTKLPELWTGTLEPLKNEPAPRVNPQIDEWQLGETKVVQWKSKDGWDVEGLLTLPIDYEKERKYPLVVVLHGGPESAITKALRPSHTYYEQVYSGRGWAVLRPNYRGGSSYGDKFLQGMNRDTGGGDYHDIMTGVDYVIAEGIADPEKMAVMGWSWGGISTGWIVTQTDRFKAASAGAMVSNHFSVFGAADLTFDVEYFYIGGSPYKDPSRYISMSPIGHVMKAKTPTLLLHGMEDIRCPYPQSVEFYKGLKAAGVETQLVGYPREPHGFREPRHMLDKMKREVAWFDKYVLEVKE
jgi:dipeptidyl aminopeptidase/acylaminoacyl peptidase